MLLLITEVLNLSKIKVLFYEKISLWKQPRFLLGTNQSKFAGVHSCWLNSQDDTNHTANVVFVDILTLQFQSTTQVTMVKHLMVSYPISNIKCVFSVDQKPALPPRSVRWIYTDLICGMYLIWGLCLLKTYVFKAGCKDWFFILLK